MNSFKVHFHGVASHGAAAPHLGKSALDGGAAAIGHWWRN